MSNIVKDISSIEIETLDNLRPSKTENKIRAYKSDFNHFVEFCKKNNFKHKKIKRAICRNDGKSYFWFYRPQ